MNIRKKPCAVTYGKGTPPSFNNKRFLSDALGMTTIEPAPGGRLHLQDIDCTEDLTVQFIYSDRLTFPPLPYAAEITYKAVYQSTTRSIRGPGGQKFQAAPYPTVSRRCIMPQGVRALTPLSTDSICTYIRKFSQRNWRSNAASSKIWIALSPRTNKASTKRQ